MRLTVTLPQCQQLSTWEDVQVALNYLVCNGAVVIPGAKSVGQMERNAGAMGWRMEENEVEIIRERLVAMKK